ncbi:MAG: hypothetical protein MHMPM18_001238 [Marteilia pararefringens]
MAIVETLLESVLYLKEGISAITFHRQADSAGLLDRIAAIRPNLLKYRHMISKNYLRNNNGYMIDHQEPNFQNYYDISSLQWSLEMPMTQRPLGAPITQRPGLGRRIIPQQYRMQMRLQAPFGGLISQQQFPMPVMQQPLQ